jgi:hypothetical protein
MARVPVYGGQRVREAPLQGGLMRQFDAGASTRQVAGALGDAADALYRRDLRDAQSQAFEAEAQITSSWLQWDAENRQRYQGQNADGYSKAAEEWWAKTSSDYGSRLNPMAREIANRALTSKRTQAMGSVVQFVSAEKERFADQAAAANIGTTIQFGVTSGNVEAAAQEVRAIVAMQGARKGWTTEQVQAAQGEALSNLHLAQITKLAEVDAESAQKYYDANKAEVGFAQQARVEQVLKGEADNQFATQFAAQNAGLPLSEQLQKAAEITDPQRRQKTILQIKSNQALLKEAEAERERQASDQAWQLAAQGQRVPESVLSQMGGRDRASLVDWQRARAERLAQGPKPVRTDPNKLAELLDMIREDTEAFKSVDMRSLTESLSTSDLEGIARLQRDLNKPEREKDVATTTQLISTFTRGMSNKDRRSEFEMAAYEELDRWEKEKKRPPNFEEKRQILNHLAAEQVTKERSWWWDASSQRYRIPIDQRDRPVVIPSSDRKLIVEALKAEGNASPSDADIMARYKLAKRLP